ncbi:MAG: 4-diphosphocytidyl-2C-methyl-D-erythritol kinase, partial [Rhizobiaceae bacterium]
MKFGSVPLAEATGAYLAHAVQAGGVRLKKGTCLGGPELALISAAGIAHVIVARMEPGDIGEDAAATRLASIAAHPSVRLANAATGRVNIHAENDGLFRVNKPVIDAINRIDPSITIATLGDYASVTRGQMVATVKLIPFAVPQAKLDAAIAAAKDCVPPLLHVAPWAAKQVGLIATALPSLKPEIMDKTARVL